MLGHAYMILLVMLCQTAVYREVTALFSIKYIEGEDTSMAKDPWSKTLNWYFFAVANYYLYGESIIYYFKVSILELCYGLNSDIPIACRIRGCAVNAFRYQPSNHQLHAVYHRIRWVRDVTEEGLLKTPIWIIRMGAHELASHCRQQVSLNLIVLSSNLHGTAISS